MSTTPAPRTNPSVGDPTARDVVVRTIVSSLVTTGGATVSAQGQRYGGSGILVTVPHLGDALNAHRPMTELVPGIRTWIDRVAPQVTGGQSAHPRYFGAWIDTVTDTLYLDVSEAFPDDELDEALTAALLRGELAVWHAGQQREIRVGSEADREA